MNTFLCTGADLHLTLQIHAVAVFMVIRKRFRKIYNPRSYLVPPKSVFRLVHDRHHVWLISSSNRQRADPLPSGFLAWIPYIFKLDAREIIFKNGLDAYVFVRFLWLMCELFFPL